MPRQRINGKIALQFKAELSKRMQILRQAFDDLYGDKRFDDKVYTKLKNVFLEIEDWLNFLGSIAEDNCDENELNVEKPDCGVDGYDAEVGQFSDDGHQYGAHSRQIIESVNCDPLSTSVAAGHSIQESKKDFEFELMDINCLVPKECGTSGLKTECGEMILIKSELDFDDMGENSSEHKELTSDRQGESDLFLARLKTERNQTQQQFFYREDTSGYTKSHKMSLICYICKETASSMDDLRTHLRKHRPYKFISCKICGKTLSQSCNLKIHHRTHTGEKPFKCNVCGKSLSCRRNLNVHLRTHTGERPFKCDVCGKPFITRWQLTVHSKIHSDKKPFKCDICDMEFMQSSHLKTHHRTHSGEKPFKCDVCGMKFNLKVNFKRHVRVHLRRVL